MMINIDRLIRKTLTIVVDPKRVIYMIFYKWPEAKLVECHEY